jgi:xanthine dehydrogenase YagS FAD-binding subunit
LDAVVQVKGPRSERSIPILEFHRLPGNTPREDTNLRPGELITAIDLPALAWARRSHYLKVRDRNSYAFALVSVAAIVDMDTDGTIRQARIALGGVAHKPWRIPQAEQLLVGKQPSDAAYHAVADALLRGAKPHRNNAFKVELARRSIVRALTTVAAMA